MMMMLMCFNQFCKFFSTYLFFVWIYLGFGPFKYFLSLDTVVRVFKIFAILHHFLNIIFHPGLFFVHLASHVSKQLLFGEVANFVLAHLNSIGRNYFVRNQGPL